MINWMDFVYGIGSHVKMISRFCESRIKIGKFKPFNPYLKDTQKEAVKKRIRDPKGRLI